MHASYPFSQQQQQGAGGSGLAARGALAWQDVHLHTGVERAEHGAPRALQETGQTSEDAAEKSQVLARYVLEIR